MINIHQFYNVSLVLSFLMIFNLIMISSQSDDLDWECFMGLLYSRCIDRCYGIYASNFPDDAPITSCVYRCREMFIINAN
mmetsp:Transcript_49420/g.60672  ORF Transcript_49420/g.60672 Transcript_49420/m.60672 type:complete len:80 (+) Transcript_49420:119-358(+)